jgi:hypothetical protein
MVMHLAPLRYVGRTMLGKVRPLQRQPLQLRLYATSKAIEARGAARGAHNVPGLQFNIDAGPTPSDHSLQLLLSLRFIVLQHLRRQAACRLLLRSPHSVSTSSGSGRHSVKRQCILADWKNSGKAQALVFPHVIAPSDTLHTPLKCSILELNLEHHLEQKMVVQLQGLPSVSCQSVANASCLPSISHNTTQHMQCS